VSARPDIARRVVIAALAASALGIAVPWLIAPASRFLPPGLVILGGAAVVSARSGARWAGVVSAVAALLVLSRFLSSEAARLDLVGELGLAFAALRWLTLVGCAVAVVAAVRVARRRPASVTQASVVTSDPGDRRGGGAGDVWLRTAQVVGLMTLSGICAELLQAYDDSTGRPGPLLFAVVFFAALYGGPALLLREVARGRGHGWPAMLLLATAFAVIQPGVIDQSMFSTGYRDIADWMEWARPTWIEGLGLSAYQSQSWVHAHVIFSYSAPIALVEAMRPASARTPWLPRAALVIPAALYLAAAGVILGDQMASESSHASARQVTGTFAVAAVLVVAAFALDRGRASCSPPRSGDRRRVAPLWLVPVATVVAVTAVTVMPQTWVGFAGALATLALGAGLLWWFSRGEGWGLAHTTSVAFGAVLTRALLAFTYFPVVGEVSPERKYAHNVVFLILVSAVGIYALHRSRQAMGAH
jgi:hypothetical protein